MKISLMSDLHLEFDPDFSPTNPGSDVLVLAGDIFVADYFTRSEASPYYAKAQQVKDFFKHCRKEWARVVYIPGNHEYYYGYIDTADQILADVVAEYDVTFLQKDYVDIEGVRFFGGTLWTDVGGRNPISEYEIRRSMNDYRLIERKSDHRKFTPLDSARIHNDTLSAMKSAFDGHEGQKVVLTHHAPSYQSVHEKYKHDVYVNHAYYSNLDQFVATLAPEYWFHGHMHNCFDYTIGKTRVVCNPKGYRNENPDFNPNLILNL